MEAERGRKARGSKATADDLGSHAIPLRTLRSSRPADDVTGSVSARDVHVESGMDSEAHVESPGSAECERPRARRKRTRCIVCACAVVLCGLVVFSSLLGVSFQYIGYDEYGLEVSLSSGRVKRGVTLYAGCYVMGPDSGLLRFPATGQSVNLVQQEVFTANRLAVRISATYIYFIRSEELGQLYTKYATDYGSVVEKIAISLLKNTAIHFSLDDLRLRRDLVAATFHSNLHRKLAGDCCQANCDFPFCNEGCRRTPCSDGLHVDVRYFYLGELAMPDAISGLLLKVALLQIQTETEGLTQEAAVITKQTMFHVSVVENEAREVLANGTAVASVIRETALNTASQMTQSALLSGWHRLNTRLNLTEENHQLSALWIKTLGDIECYHSVDYMKSARFRNTAS